MEKELEKIRHSASHVLAQAVLELYPDAKLAIGPAIEDGFYYDFDLGGKTFAENDLPKIEKKMKHIIKQNQMFEKYEQDAAESIKYLKSKKQPYKVEMAEELVKQGEKKLGFYKMVMSNGKKKFVDLCAGPHVESTKEIGAVKLLKTAGAYWRGDEKNKMLQRIYGTAFTKESELKDWLLLQEEAQKRDHKKLGVELDLYSFHSEAPGSPFFHNNGMIILNELIDFWREKHKERNYLEIKTPIILSRNLWETSGHWDLYKENMYTTKIDDMDYAIKPMNCPGGMLIYNETKHSYRELPLRVGELGLVHRHELSGVLNGLFRVRTFTQDDAHVFCTPEQLEGEIIDIVKLIQEMFGVFGFTEYKFTLSIRGAKKKEKYLGTDKEWDWAQNAILGALKKLKIKSEMMEGEAKFYGPSLDVQIKDALGREWQCSTIQLDFNLAKRFDITYVGEDSKDHTPYILHRVVYGSLERFFGILVEHYAGAFPLWISPTQAAVIPVGADYVKDSQKIADEMKEKGIRVSVDDANETVGNKIRKAVKEKIPYLIVIGEKELKSKKLPVRKRGSDKVTDMGKDEFVKKLIKEIQEKK